MSEIRIGDLRISSVWVELLPEMLDGGVPAEAPLGMLADGQRYAELFDRAQAGDPELELSPPWKSPAGQHFWTYYPDGKLGKRPGDLRGKEARRLAVPLRGAVPARIEAPWLEGYLDLEAFYFPFGLGLVFTAASRAALDLAQAAQKAYEITRQGRYAVTWQGAPEESESLSLAALADGALRRLRRQAFGEGVGGHGTSEPFTVATVVRGEGVDANVPVPEGEEIHRFLHAVTAWPQPGRKVKLPPLAKSSLETWQPSAGDVLYRTSRGRAVWFPFLFGQRDSSLHSLGCYHRNLIFGGLQTESLLSLVREAEARRAAAGGLTGTIVETSRQAVLALGRLYGDAAYRSWSIRDHIDSSGTVPAINQLRDYHDPGLGPLRGKAAA